MPVLAGSRSACFQRSWMPRAMSATMSPHRNSSQSAPVKQNEARDPLTGLYRRAHLCDKINRLLAQPRGERITATLALLQLENFYEIRAWVGKPEANLLLSDIALLLKRSLPGSVILCRCEHYEFAALLTDECSVNAAIITDRVKLALLSAVSDAIPPQLELKCAVGLAEMEIQTPSADVLFARARHRLSAAFANPSPDGKWQVTPRLTPQSVIRLVQRAQQQNGFSLNFQAVVDLRGDCRRHFEVRCALKTAGDQVPAGLLYEVASQNALACGIDRWVVRRVIGILRQDKAGKLYFTVNLSHNSLVNPDFFRWLERLLQGHAQLAKRLTVQISEVDVLIAQHHMNFVCEQLKALNLGLCIKHFGCTENPFRYLSLLSARQVCLDAALLDNISRDPHKRAELETTVRQLHDREFRVIAAQVENMRQLPVLWRTGIDLVQGFCLQPPTDRLDYAFIEHLRLEPR